MDNRGRIIVEISSDEDVGWVESGVTCDRGGGGGGGAGGRDDGDWISELLDEVEKEVDDPDELLMLGEVFANRKQIVAKSFAKCVDNEEEDDDDCVVLEGDPDKPVALDDDGGEDSDDLCVVFEKGQVACRDYPHPRHLCVRFPFQSTPHERHCDQCHCYVCDSVAPCVHWGNGFSSIDHCHATEKDEFWKAQRKHLKKCYQAPPGAPRMRLAPMNQVSSLRSCDLMRNQVLPAIQPCSITTTTRPDSVVPVRSQDCGYNQVQSLPSNPLMHIPVLPPSQPCFINSTETPNSVMPVRTEESGHNQVSSGNLLVHNKELPARQPSSVRSASTPSSVLPVRTQVFGNDLHNKFQPHLISHHLHRQNLDHAGPQFIPQRVAFKRPGVVGGVLATNRHDDRLCNNTSVYEISRNQSSGSRWHDPSARENSMSTSYQSSNPADVGGVGARSVRNSSTWSPVVNGLGNYASSHSQISSQIHSNSVNADSGASQPQLSSTFMASDFRLSMPTVPGITTQQRQDSPFENGMPLQPQAASEPNVGTTYQNVVPTEPLVTSHDSIVYHSESPVNFNQDAPMSQNSQSVPVECSQLQSTILRERPAIVIDSQLPSSTNFNQADCQFNMWSPEDQSAFAYLDIPLSPALDLFSAESAPVDAGLLFEHSDA